MSVPVDADLEQRVAELVGQRRPMLEQLVRQALERELLAVLAEVDGTLGRLASSDGTPALIEAAEEVLEIPAAVEAEAPVALCARCGVEPRLPRGSYCRTCKRRNDLESRARRRERRTASLASQDGAGDADDRPGDLRVVLRSRPVRRLENGHGGITAAELLERDGNRYGRLSARELHRWLLASGFAEDGDGLLRPTVLGREVGAVLATL